jgi:hypothetical protein
VFVWSGNDGGLLHWFVGDSPGDFFGSDVDGIGDVDADGFADVLVGAFLTSLGGTASVFSGRTGQRLYMVQGGALTASFGYSVAGLGDLDGDGRGEFIVGAPDDSTLEYRAGAAYIFSGQFGTLLKSLYGDEPDDPWNFFELYGWSVADAGDVNADGTRDLIIGSYGDSNQSHLLGLGGAHIYSGRGFRRLLAVFGDEVNADFGWAV